MQVIDRLSSTVALLDLYFIGLSKQKLLLFLGLGVLFVLNHLLFRSPITDHVWRATVSVYLPL